MLYIMESSIFVWDGGRGLLAFIGTPYTLKLIFTRNYKMLSSFIFYIEQSLGKKKHPKKTLKIDNP